MFSFFKKKSKSSIPFDIAEVYCDMHSHLIPGIDDGAADMETALLMIKGMQALGYKKLITTPHVMSEMYKNSREGILAAYQNVRSRLEEEKIPVILEAAAEYYMDEYFDDLLAGDEPLLTLKDNLVLVEFSLIREPVEVKEMLFKLQIKGYQPVIAHPERYLYFGAHKNWYDELKGEGCLFQLNLLSACGFYGKKQEELSQYLVKKKYIDLVGSDLHHLRHLEILKHAHSIWDTVRQIQDEGLLQNPQL
jgi:protein-tyrosine phosphatase